MFRFPAYALLALIGLAASVSASAATFTVNSEADVPDATPGNGACNPEFGLPGVCSLRAAIMEANALPGLDVIILTAEQTYTLTRMGNDDTAAFGDLDITEDVIIGIDGGDHIRPVVDAAGIDRVFDIHSVNVGFQGFDIAGGSTAQSPNDEGGAIRKNAGSHVIELLRMRIYGNQAGHGAAIFTSSFADVRVRDSWIFDNVGGSTIRAWGMAKLLVVGGAMTGNECIQGNSCSVVNAQGGTMVTVINSTIGENSGLGLFMLNSGDVTLRNATIAGNGHHGLLVESNGNLVVDMTNTVIGRNAVSDCELAVTPMIIYDIDGHNLSSDGTCGLQNGSTNLTNSDPLLTPLKFRRGVTPMYWPRPDSPLIEGGPQLIAECEPHDQHGLARPQDFGLDGTTRCDIGAAEVPADAIFFDSNEVLQ